MQVLSRAVLPFLLIFSASCLAQAQPQGPPSSEVVDGAVNPERIPDTLAYQFYFIIHSTKPGASQQEMAVQNARLAKLHLTNADRLTVISVLQGFKSSYESLVENFNRAAASAEASGNADTVDQNWLLSQIESLVTATHVLLRQQLSPLGLANLEAQVQRDKANIKMRQKKQQKK